MKTVIRDACNDAVVIYKAVITQQDPVACTAHREICPVVDVEAVQERGRIRSHDFNFA